MNYQLLIFSIWRKLTTGKLCTLIFAGFFLRFIIVRGCANPRSPAGGQGFYGVLLDKTIFAFEKLSQAKMLGSAPFLCAVSAGAEFSPRAQAGAVAGAANCRFEKVNIVLSNNFKS